VSPLYSILFCGTAAKNIIQFISFALIVVPSFKIIFIVPSFSGGRRSSLLLLSVLTFWRHLPVAKFGVEDIIYSQASIISF
jgi:hypothetical protein